jgi:hypothetical protein
VHLKKIARVPDVFRDSLRPIPNLAMCPSSHGVSEPTSAAIPIDHLIKQSALMQKINFRNGKGKTKMAKMVSRRELPCVRRSRSSYKGMFFCRTPQMSMERKK